MRQLRQRILVVVFVVAEIIGTIEILLVKLVIDVPSPQALQHALLVVPRPWRVALQPVGGIAATFERGADLRFIKRSEEHTSELQSPMRTSYAVFCLTKKNIHNHHCTH